MSARKSGSTELAPASRAASRRRREKLGQEFSVGRQAGVLVALKMKDFFINFLGYEPSYFEVKTNGASQFETMIAYLGGSMFQTVGDNPITAYRQLVQQYAKGTDGKMVDPKIASAEAKAVFRASPISASMSGLGPRIVGVMFKRVPKFGILLGLSYIIESDGEVGMMAATGASILSAPFINPIRMIEKQQRAYFKITGKEKPVVEILKESRSVYFQPLFRGTIPLMGHSFASAALGLVGQPKLKKWVQKKLGSTGEISFQIPIVLRKCLPVLVGSTQG